MFRLFSWITLAAWVPIAAFGQATVQLPLDASNCAIAKALGQSDHATCMAQTQIRQKRGIVLRLDEEIARHEREDMEALLVRPKPSATVTNEVVKKEVVASVAPTPKPKPAKVTAPKIDKAAAEPRNGYFIQFAFGSFDIEPKFEDHIQRLAAVLASEQMRNLCVRITGHTDSIGSEAANLKLSENRAVIVASRLADIGQISPSRIHISAAGESALLPDVPGEHPLNRRVEFATKEGCNG